MCKMASFIITKTEVLWSINSDSHEVIINENNLDDKTNNPDFVRVEIVPQNDCYKLPLTQWLYNKDQDYLPDWYNPQEAEIACRAELDKWAAYKIIIGGTHKLSGIISKIFINSIFEIDKMTGGDCCFSESSQGTVSGQTGGECWFSGSSQMFKINLTE